MASRLELHEELVNILGSRNVYFQPPSNVKLKYPCIIYDFAKPDVEHANNFIYMYTKAYEVIIIDQNKDSELPDKFIRFLPYISYSRAYPADGLWHFVYNLYF